MSRERGRLCLPSRAAIREQKNALVARGGRAEECRSRRERENQLTTLTNEAPYKACSGFTHVTARRIARPPKVTFVTRVQPSRLPSQDARQLPDLSIILRVESSSTGVSRLRGALPASDVTPVPIGSAFARKLPPDTSDLFRWLDSTALDDLMPQRHLPRQVDDAESRRFHGQNPEAKGKHRAKRRN
jgi:hypothetical protein